jgi:hypothetical protein
MSRRRIALVLGAAVLITVLVPAPAGAQTEDRKRERLELECRPVSEANAPAVACKWSASSHPDLAGYRLFRAQRWMGQVVYRGKETSFVDHDVKPGRRYFYAAQAINANGRTLGRSNVEKVAVPPSPERLKLDCSLVNDPTAAQADLIADRAVACKWSASTAPLFDHYRLGRFGRGGRQVVYEGKDTQFIDREIKPGNYRYVVGAFSASGRLLGWSNWSEVRVPPKPEPKPVPKPEPKPRPEPRPKPAPEPRPKPRPEPEPKPWPRPEPKPEPRPAPADMRLACKVTDSSLHPAAGPSVVCEWSPVKGAAGYILWRSDGDGPRQAVFKTRDGLRFLDTTVASGHRYRYAVTAVNAGGEVVAKSEVVFVAGPPTKDVSPQPADSPKPAGETSSDQAA